MKAYIRLEYGSAILTAAQRLRYKRGDILQGTCVGTMHETLAEWDITEVEAAITRLTRFKCEDKQLEPDVYRVEEYGLVFVVPDKMVWYTIAAPEAVVAATYMTKEAWIHGYKVVTMDDWTFEKDGKTYMYVCIQHFKSGARVSDPEWEKSYLLEPVQTAQEMFKACPCTLVEQLASFEPYSKPHGRLLRVKLDSNAPILNLFR